MFTARLSGGASVTLRPRSRIWPLVGRSNPAIMRSGEVLPQPDGPSREKNSPGRSSRVTPSTATTSPKCFSIRSRRTSGTARDAGDAIVGDGIRGRLTVCAWASRGAEPPASTAARPADCPLSVIGLQAASRARSGRTERRLRDDVAVLTAPRSRPDGHVALAAAQALYYLGTGAAPLVSMRAFEAVSGPKRDHWLVRTVGLLALGFGGLLARDAVRGRPDPAIGIAGAVPFALASLWYGGTSKVSRVYLLDGVLELAFTLAWLLLGRQRSGGDARANEARRAD